MSIRRPHQSRRYSKLRGRLRKRPPELSDGYDHTTDKSPPEFADDFYDSMAEQIKKHLEKVANMKQQLKFGRRLLAVRLKGHMGSCGLLFSDRPYLGPTVSN